MNFSISHTGTDSGEVEREEPNATMVVESGMTVGLDMIDELHRLESIEISHKRLLAALNKVAREYRGAVLPGGLINAPYQLALALDSLMKAVNRARRR
ncbi:hypothetical protein CMK11_22535 [Candidatus Poribacteria bacterium]|nr:hypothetical protein [Candidatus Poribacteria bacterium]